ncbi:MAG: GNAT family N-acetyltransferase [Clostridiaceae bacterium]|nr:GNAT family N-acetyltransferase [Clostridiaceae bacterium]
MEYREFGTEQMARVREMYEQEGWNAYLHDDEKLRRAFTQSLYLLGAFDGGKLVGLIRCVGDGEHIVLVQDLIVDRAWRRQGVGSQLFRAVWEKYRTVRMFQVVTDIEDEADNRFYRSFGMKPLADGNMISYFR